RPCQPRPSFLQLTLLPDCPPTASSLRAPLSARTKPSRLPLPKSASLFHTPRPAAANFASNGSVLPSALSKKRERERSAGPALKSSPNSRSCAPPIHTKGVSATSSSLVARPANPARRFLQGTLRFAVARA